MIRPPAFAAAVLAAGLAAGWLMAAFAFSLPPRLPRPAAAVALVDRAAALVEADVMQAIDAFDRDCSFRSDRLFVFVLAEDGVSLYHAADRTLIGRDFTALTDAAGRPFGRRLVAEASPDGVWHAYQTTEPGGSDPVWLLTYARRTGDGHIVAAGLRPGKLN